MTTKMGVGTQTEASAYLLSMGGVYYKVVQNADSEPVKRILDADPSVLISVRKYYETWDQEARLRNGSGEYGGYAGGTRVAHESAEQFAGIKNEVESHGKQLVMEGFNETGQWDLADAFTEHSMGFIDTCYELGIVPAIFSFATGNPPGYAWGPGTRYDTYYAALGAYWDHYVPAIRKLYVDGTWRGKMALHEYAAPTMQTSTPYLVGRLTQVLDVLPEDCKGVPILITESGIDGGTAGASTAEAAGWKNYCKNEDGSINEEQYADQLEWADDLYLSIPNVEGVAIFTAGYQGQWDSFDIKDRMIIAERFA